MGYRAVVKTLCAILFLAAPAALAASDYPGMLKEAFDAEPSIKRAQARVAGSRADEDVALSGMLPRVTLSAGASQTGEKLSAGSTSQDDSVTGYSFGVTATENLLHFPTILRHSAAKLQTGASEEALNGARQELVVRFTGAYFNLLRAKLDRRIAGEHEGRIRAVLEQANAFLKAGTGDIISVYEAKARHDGALAELSRLDSAVKLASDTLSSLVGRPVEAVADYTVDEVTGPKPDDLDAWIERMDKNDPAIRQAKASLSRAAKEIEAVNAEYLPYLQLNAGYAYNDGRLFVKDGSAQTWSAGASIVLPLFSGGETGARVRRAVADESQQNHFLTEVRRARREAMRQIINDLRYGVVLSKALKLQRESAELQLTAVRKGRTIGTRNAVDVLNAEEAFSNAERDLKHTVYTNIVRSIELNALAGEWSEGLLQSLGVKEAAR